jgi:hypothetical protein
VSEIKASKIYFVTFSYLLNSIKQYKTQISQWQKEVGFHPNISNGRTWKQWRPYESSVPWMASNLFSFTEGGV